MPRQNSKAPAQIATTCVEELQLILETTLISAAALGQSQILAFGHVVKQYSSF
jgi:hypothetical protein